MGDGRHCRNDVNNVDPDEGNSWLCSACKLPIFATPFIGDGKDVVHDQCGNLPAELKGCELHPEKPLLLRDNHHQESCSECREKCGSKVYYCPDSECGLILDVACALHITILHRSHLQHRLVAVRKSSLGTCDVCGATHEAEAEAEGRSYFCVVCGFWIHPKCARLPNVIQHEKHEHSLLLYYDVGASFGVTYGEESGKLSVHRISLMQSEIRHQRRLHAQNRVCAICEGNVGTRFGIYSCIKCRDYCIHIRCAISDSRAVLSVEAQFPGLVRLPIPDEHQSFVGYARGGDASIKYKSIKRHGHQLILHKNEDENAGDEVVCDMCVKVIKKPPFYSCTVCPNFFLHHYCYYRLPMYRFSHPAHHKSGHVLTLRASEAGVRSSCPHCRCPSLRVHYACDRCPLRFDLSCALMPVVVTHDAHAASHFLRLSDHSPGHGCHCCGRSLGRLGYECQTCPNFALHTWCAMLPKTVTHKFDPHPLRLITSGVGVAEICEICEKGINNKVWHYGCGECDQWFHIDCIPCLDLVSKIKSLAMNMDMDVPSRLLRGLTLQGHRDDYCTDVADEYDILLSD